nr:hypothetical protein CFP56_10037 [Quercus suber]
MTRMAQTCGYVLDFMMKSLSFESLGSRHYIFPEYCRSDLPSRLSSGAEIAGEMCGCLDGHAIGSIDCRLVPAYLSSKVWTEAGVTVHCLWNAQPASRNETYTRSSPYYCYRARDQLDRNFTCRRIRGVTAQKIALAESSLTLDKCRVFLALPKVSFEQMGVRTLSETLRHPKASCVERVRVDARLKDESAFNNVSSPAAGHADVLDILMPLCIYKHNR